MYVSSTTLLLRCPRFLDDSCKSVPLHCGGPLRRQEGIGDTREHAASAPTSPPRKRRDGLEDKGSGSRTGEDPCQGGEADGVSPLLVTMLEIFRDPRLEKMLERLDSILTESTTYSRNPAVMRHQVVCAGLGSN